MAGLAPRIIVVALGSGALGGPDALRVLLEFAGRNPLLDIAICVCVIAMFTAQLLGVVLLARFISKPRAQAGGTPGASATDCFAKMTLVVSVGAAFLVTACLLVASGGLGSVRVVFDVAGRSPVIAVASVGAAAAAVPCIRTRLPVFREAENEGRAAPSARAASRTPTAHLTGSLVAGICLLLGIALVAPGGLDALRLVHGSTSTFAGVGVGAATVVATVLAAGFSRRTRNASGIGGLGAAPRRWGASAAS